MSLDEDLSPDVFAKVPVLDHREDSSLSRAGAEPIRVDEVDSVLDQEPERHLRPSRGVHGRITSSEGEPVAGAHVIANLPGDLARFTRSDVDGNYAIEMDWSGWFGEAEHKRDGERAKFRKRARRELGLSRREQEGPEGRQRLERFLKERTVLLVSATDSMNRRAERRIEFHDTLSASLRVDLKLDSRPAFGGRVLGTNGGEVGVDVMLFDADWRLTQTTLSDDAGQFRFHPPEAGTYYMHARKVDAGTAFVSGIYLASGLTPVEQEMTLGGAHTLRGQLLLPSGEAARGLEICGVASQLAMAAMPRPTYPETDELVRFEEYHGLAHSYATTDEEGRFWMHGMQPGNFMLFFEGLSESLQPTGIYNTGPEHEIVFEGHILRVIFEGEPEVLAEAEVHALEADTHGLRRKHGLRHVAKPCCGSEVQFVVEPDSTWSVFWEHQGTFGYRRSVTMDTKSHLQVIQLHVYGRESTWGRLGQDSPDLSASGRMDVQLRDEEGKRVAASVSLWKLEAEGTRQVFSELPCDESTRLPALPTGPYHYSVSARGDLQEWALPIDAGIPVEIRAGDERRLEHRLQLGGRLELKVTAGEGVPEFGERSRLRLFGQDADAESTRLDVAASDDNGLPRASVAAGETVLTHQLIPVGKYRLVLLDSEGRERGSAQVEVKAKQITPVEIVIERAGD